MEHVPAIEKTKCHKFTSQVYVYVRGYLHWTRMHTESSVAILKQAQASDMLMQSS